MKILTTVARKGGVGKTTFTYLLGIYLAIKMNKKVLLIDGDPQANLTSCFFDEEQDDCLGEFLKNKNDNIFEFIRSTSLPNLHIIPTNFFLDELNQEFISKPVREKIVFNKILPNYNELASKYDYIIIDTNPSLSLINQNMMLIANDVIIISDRSKFSLDGVIKLANTWRAISEALGSNYNLNNIILNKMTNDSTSKQFIEAMFLHFPNQVLQNYIKEYTSIEKSVVTIDHQKTLKRIEKVGNPIKNVVNELIAKGVL